MNKICNTCDTRIRLCRCPGRDGDFKNCYRPCGSVSNITPETIQPFNKYSEIRTPYDDIIVGRIDSSLEMGEKSEPIDQCHTVLLTALVLFNKIKNNDIIMEYEIRRIPIGHITI